MTHLHNEATYDSSHISQARSLTEMTYKFLVAGKQLTPDMYVGIFPGYHTMDEGYEATYDVLDACRLEAKDDAVKTERLVELFRQTNIIGKHIFGPNSATTAGTYLIEVNEILRNRSNVLDVSFDVSEVGAKKQYVQDECDILDASKKHPPEYYAVVEGMARLHAHVSTMHNLSEAIVSMRRTNSRLSYYGLSGAVAANILMLLKDRLGDSVEYYQERNRLPYKRILFDMPEDQERCAKEAKGALLDYAAKKHAHERVSSEVFDLPRKENYDTTLRIVCGVYAVLRKAGYSQQRAIKGIYANTDLFKAHIKAVTDAYPFRPHFFEDGRNGDHLFAPLYEDVHYVKLSAYQTDGVPRLHFSPVRPYPRGALPSHLPADRHQRFVRLRQTTGRCPARHLMPAPEQGLEHLILFSDEITHTKGIDPKIFTASKKVSIVNTIMAMTVHQAEKAALFDALDERFRKERIL